MMGEMPERAEEEVAQWFSWNGTKPIFAFIAGQTALVGSGTGHAGAIISGREVLSNERKSGWHTPS